MKPDCQAWADADNQAGKKLTLRLGERMRPAVMRIAGIAVPAPVPRKVAVEIDSACVRPRSGGDPIWVCVLDHPEVALARKRH